MLATQSNFSRTLSTMLQLIVWLILWGLFFSTANSAEQTKVKQATPATDIQTKPLADPSNTETTLRDMELIRQQQIAQLLNQQDPVWLKNSKQDWLAVYHQDETGKRLGTIILITDIGLQVTQPGLITTLAKKLPSKGWSTMSLSLPLNRTDQNQANNAKELLTAAIEKGLQTQPGDFYIVLQGNHQSLFEALPETVKGLVLINLPMSRKSNLPAALDTATIPILDIVATRDRLMNNKAWQRRKNLAVSKNLPYRQLVYDGIDKNFSGVENSLVRVVSAWLAKQNESAQKETL